MDWARHCPRSPVCDGDCPGIDNILFISIVTSRLPIEQQRKARLIGLALAMGFRILLLCFIATIVTWTKPVFLLEQLAPLSLHSWLAEHASINEVSVRDLILLCGGLFLLYQSVREIHHLTETSAGSEAAVTPQRASFTATLVQIALLDIVFSLDSVITAVGMVDSIPIMIGAVVLSVVVMMLFSGPISNFVLKHPSIKVLALSFLLMIGAMLVAEGFGTHFNKNYLYFAMAFALGVELLNLRIHRTRDIRSQGNIAMDQLLDGAPDRLPTPPSFVVGIGASAGGLESLERFFQNMPEDTGLAFVVVQHLSPDFKSMMNELLARDTKMPIVRIEDGMSLVANHIYLLPPKKELVIESGMLHLLDKDPLKGLTLPIDRFFESLGHAFGPRAIGIILSGSGSDGSRGVRELAKAGGLVLCESEETAKFDGMPLSAQATGLVNLVLPPEKMGPVLASYALNPQALKTPGSSAFATEQTGLRLRGPEAIYDCSAGVRSRFFSLQGADRPAAHLATHRDVGYANYRSLC